MTLAAVANAATQSQAADAHLYALRNPAAPIAYRIELGDEPKRLLHAALVRAARHTADLTALSYDPVVLCPGGHCLVIPNIASPRLVAATAAVDAHPATLFDPHNGAAGQLFALAAELRLPGGQRPMGFREQKPSRMLGRSKSVALLYRDGRYDRLDPLDVLQLDLSFDVLTAEGDAYFEKKRTFARRVAQHVALLRGQGHSTFPGIGTSTSRASTSSGGPDHRDIRPTLTQPLSRC